jgi:hypothetical protein
VRVLAPKERLLTTLLPEAAREADETVSCWKRKEPRLAKLLGRKLCCEDEEEGAACSCSVMWCGGTC